MKFKNLPQAARIDASKLEEQVAIQKIAVVGAESEAVEAQSVVDNLKVGPLGSFELKGRDPKIDGDASVTLAAEFGATVTGQVLVFNDGVENDLVIESGTLSGDAAAAFRVLSEFPVTLAPGESGMIDVEFTAPNELGNVNAILTLVNNDTLEIAQNRIVELIGSPFASTGRTFQLPILPLGGVLASR